MQISGRRKAELLLAGVIALRSTSLLFASKALAYMGPLTLNGLRFPVAFIVLLFVFRKDIRRIDSKTLLHGSIIGFFFYLTMVTEMIGLKYTSSSMTSFLENTAVVIVPLINAILIRRLPKRATVISSIIALTGVGFLTLKGGHFGMSLGEICCIVSAVFYSATIITTDRFSKEDEPALLGFIQVGFIAIASFATAYFVESPEIPTQAAAWGPVIFLALVCTCVGFTLQPVAQSKVSTEFAALSCSINPLMTAVLGYVFLGERLGFNGLIGGALIIVSILADTILSKHRTNIGKQGKPVLVLDK